MGEGRGVRGAAAAGLRAGPKLGNSPAIPMSSTETREALAGTAPSEHASRVRRPRSAEPMAEPPRPLASLRYPSLTGAEARFDRPPANVRRLTVIPERYSTREKDGVRSIDCDEAPRIRVVID